MDVLSTSAGSAQAIAAAASEAVDSRAALERELDRLNAAIGAHAGAAAQHLQWTLLAQALLVTAYLVVLVGAWALPLPGKRWLLAAIAGYALLSLVLGHLSHRGSRDRIGPLRQSRRLVEQALERIAARPIVFSRDGAIARSLGDWATSLMRSRCWPRGSASRSTRSRCRSRRTSAARTKRALRPARRRHRPRLRARKELRSGARRRHRRRSPSRPPRARNRAWRRCSGAR
jgi:hypothetical protein